MRLKKSIGIALVSCAAVGVVGSSAAVANASEIGSNESSAMAPITRGFDVNSTTPLKVKAVWGKFEEGWAPVVGQTVRMVHWEVVFGWGKPGIVELDGGKDENGNPISVEVRMRAGIEGSIPSCYAAKGLKCRLWEGPIGRSGRIDISRT